MYSDLVKYLMFNLYGVIGSSGTSYSLKPKIQKLEVVKKSLLGKLENIHLFSLKLQILDQASNDKRISTLIR